MNGFLNILKPPGMTSAAVVAQVKRLTREKRVGHAGTLDPDAAGILPVMIGRAARLFDYLVDKEKTYVAEVAFTGATDTQDASGTLLAASDNHPTIEAVRAAADRLIGDVWQTPSAYSAIKQNGEALYEKARRGESVTVPPRLVHIERIEVAREMPRHGFLMTIDCGRGTYIRSICHDLGEMLACPAHMRFLLRTRSGAFTLDSAMTLEEATALAEAGTLARQLIPMDAPLGHIPRADVPDYLRKLVDNGVPIPVGRCAMPALEVGAVCRIYMEGLFRGMAVREDDTLVWRFQLPREEVMP